MKSTFLAHYLEAAVVSSPGSFPLTVVSRSPQTGAVLATLTAAGLLAGDGTAPPGGGWQGVTGQSDFVPYVVVHSIAGGVEDGTLADPWADTEWYWQVTAVGSTRAQAEWAGDKTRIALLSTPVAISGRSTLQVRIDVAAGAQRDDTVQPPVWVNQERYALLTAPT